MNNEEELEKKPEKLVAVGILEDSTFTGKTRVKSKSNKFSSCDELDYPTPKKHGEMQHQDHKKHLKKGAEKSVKKLCSIFSLKRTLLVDVSSVMSVSSLLVMSFWKPLKRPA